MGMCLSLKGKKWAREPLGSTLYLWSKEGALMGCSQISSHWVTHWTSCSGSALGSLPLVDSTLLEYVSQDTLVQRVTYLLSFMHWLRRLLMGGASEITWSCLCVIQRRDVQGRNDPEPRLHSGSRAHGQGPGLLIHRPGLCSLPISASEGTGDYPFSRCLGPTTGLIPA